MSNFNSDVNAVDEMTKRQSAQVDSTAQFYSQAYEEYDRENSSTFGHADDRGICYTRDISSTPESSSMGSRLGISGYFRGHKSANRGIDFGSHVNIASLELDIGLSQEARGLQKWCRFLSNALCPCCWKDHGLEDRPSNEELLSLAFFSFFTFTICQVIAGFFSSSESLLADSCVMAIDSFTYGCNLIAERMKNRIDSIVDYNHRGQDPNITEDESERRRHRSKRKLKLHLEVIPPIVSMLTLSVVTSIVIHDSIRVLIGGIKNDENDANEDHASHPDTTIMFIFSALNLVVDAVNVLFFVKADHAFGFHTTEEKMTRLQGANIFEYKNTQKGKEEEGYSIASQRRDSEDEEVYHDDKIVNDNVLNLQEDAISTDDNERGHDKDITTLNHVSVSIPSNDTDEFDENDVDRMIANFEQRKVRANLNMCSAYTHIMADTVSEYLFCDGYAYICVCIHLYSCALLFCISSRSYGVLLLL